MKLVNALRTRSLRIGIAAAILGVAFAGAAHAQLQPTPTAVLLSKELMELKGGMKAFDPIVTGVIESHRRLLIQSNPNMQRDIDAVATQLRTELATRLNELHAQIANSYALYLTEQELKDAIAFFKSPIGRKLLSEEPKAIEASMKKADEWSHKFAEEVVAKLRGELRKKGLNPI